MQAMAFVGWVGVCKGEERKGGKVVGGEREEGREKRRRKGEGREGEGESEGSGDKRRVFISESV